MTAANILVLIATYPLTVFPANQTLESALFDKTNKYWSRNFTRFLVCFSAAYLGIELSHVLDKFMSLLGALALAPLALILPTMCHLKAVAATMSEKIEDLILLIISILVMVFCVVQTLETWN